MDLKEEKKERFFFAFWPDSHRQSLLGRLREELFAGIQARAIPPEFLHLTVLFLGWTSPRSIEEIIKELPGRLKTEGFPLFFQFSKAVFKRRGKEGIIWLEAVCVPPPAERLLQDLIQLMTQKKLSFQAHSPFVPHITIFRHVLPQSLPGNLAKRKEIELPAPFELGVDTLYLVRSELKAEGSDYKKVFSFPLAQQN